MKVKFMKTSEFLRFFITICLSVGAQIGYGAISTVPQPLSHYDVIMERAPFGPIPKKLTPEEEAAAAVGEEETPPEEVVPEELPPAFEQIKVTAITMFGGKPAAGFTDGASNKSYYLREGEEFESYSLVNVDFDGMKITLRQNELEADLPLWINPATTNRADISSFGVTDPATLAALATNTVAATSVVDAPQVNEPPAIKTAEELEREKRREEWRKKRDEERERRRKELEAMTPEERNQHLRQVNMDLIRSGDGPPLPIELNREEMEQLASEGFAVPGINAPIPEGMPNLGDPSNNRPRGRNRRGGRGSFGPPPNVTPGGTE